MADSEEEAINKMDSGQGAIDDYDIIDIKVDEYVEVNDK